MTAPRTPRATARQPRHAPRAARTPFLLVLLGLVVGGLCALLALNTASAANELQRHQYASTDESVANDVAALQNDVAASAAPGNVARAAEALGMVPAGNPAFLVVKPDGSIELMGSPAPATDTYVPPPPPTTPKSTPHSSATSSPKSTASSSAKSSAKSSPGSTAKSTSHSTASSSPGSTAKSTPQSSAGSTPSSHAPRSTGGHR